MNKCYLWYNRTILFNLLFEAAHHTINKLSKVDVLPVCGNFTSALMQIWLLVFRITLYIFSNTFIFFFNSSIVFCCSYIPFISTDLSFHIVYTEVFIVTGLLYFFHSIFILYFFLYGLYLFYNYMGNTSCNCCADTK